MNGGLRWAARKLFSRSAATGPSPGSWVIAGKELMRVEIRGTAPEVSVPAPVLDGAVVDVESRRRSAELLPVGNGFLALAPVAGSGMQRELKLDLQWMRDLERRRAGGGV